MTIHYFAIIMNRLGFELEPQLANNWSKESVCKFDGGYSRSYKDGVVMVAIEWWFRFNLTTIIQPQFKFLEICSALN